MITNKLQSVGAGRVRRWERRKSRGMLGWCVGCQLQLDWGQGLNMQEEHANTNQPHALRGRTEPEEEGQTTQTVNNNTQRGSSAIQGEEPTSCCGAWGQTG